MTRNFLQINLCFKWVWRLYWRHYDRVINCFHFCWLVNRPHGLSIYLIFFKVYFLFGRKYCRGMRNFHESSSFSELPRCKKVLSNLFFDKFFTHCRWKRIRGYLVCFQCEFLSSLFLIYLTIEKFLYCVLSFLLWHVNWPEFVKSLNKIRSG